MDPFGTYLIQNLIEAAHRLRVEALALTQAVRTVVRGGPRAAGRARATPAAARAKPAWRAPDHGPSLSTARLQGALPAENFSFKGWGGEGQGPMAMTAYSRMLKVLLIPHVLHRLVTSE